MSEDDTFRPAVDGAGQGGILEVTKPPNYMFTVYCVPSLTLGTIQATALPYRSSSFIIACRQKILVTPADMSL